MSIRHGNAVAKHRRPGVPKMPWLFQKGESTWRGFITFSVVTLAVCASLFVAS